MKKTPDLSPEFFIFIPFKPDVMNYILFDDNNWDNLLPLTFTRPVAELRAGILTIKEKWDILLQTQCSHYSKEYLRIKYKPVVADDNIAINGALLPDGEIIRAIGSLKPGEGLFRGEILLAARMSSTQVYAIDCGTCPKDIKKIEWNAEVAMIRYPWDIFGQNGVNIESDFALITKGRKSAGLSKTNNILNPENIFVEPGAKAEFVTLNASTGPIYIGKDAEIMEGSLIRGPFALCDHSTVKMGAKIYGPTTIGPCSRAGGEINNCVFIGYSNKGHDGFLGNSVLGEWCNLGADTNNSNLKNNYAEVKVWNYVKDSFIPSGLQFCGLIMGDHSKSGINTMFNTGTVVGVSANIFGAGYPRNFIPSFSWGGPGNIAVYPLPRAFEVAERVMSRRDVVFDDVEKKILEEVFNLTIKYRRF